MVMVPYHANIKVLCPFNARNGFSLLLILLAQLNPDCQEGTEVTLSLIPCLRQELHQIQAEGTPQTGFELYISSQA